MKARALSERIAQFIAVNLSILQDSDKKNFGNPVCLSDLVDEVTRRLINIQSKNHLCYFRWFAEIHQYGKW